ncbi:MAG: hypothetical protein COT81_00645 [Candidatus Buchananbacteria bacterium CG10_big_fil_rev_8_21_14_0_10_42_9]|uniref:Photosynthesis system II assembly factor Ycf48/Hcf136-like domain-containing protein n=1 Tax=Candidatus Buchananbacteria bacterium CG10_big_fil_rev_8_21_14_0_10_42_9 TaxID=1974526 RepID=A0A2H0W2B4_9BACT|nr:MAG: hypothetical protein COT81_00645 [Candidatus Buchananbacteria bacterium CG10_big_fil_rev_8_21_14_0_10_42_9]
MPKKLSIILFLSALIFSGCSLALGSRREAPQAVDAGVWMSIDKGQTWVKKDTFISPQGLGSITEVSVTELELDPRDERGLYITTDADGYLYSYDRGESWQQPQSYNVGAVRDLAIDFQDNCNIYLAYANKVIKSTDCNRSFRDSFVDSRPSKIVTAVATDPNLSGVVYAGTDNGEIIKSTDFGYSWTTINRVNNAILDILVDPRNSNVIYVGTRNLGLLKSSDGGVIWSNSINLDLKKYSGANEYRRMVFFPSVPNGLLLVTRYGIHQSFNGGETWETFDLITPQLSTEIFSIAVSPDNSQEIYYGTATTFYKTIDGGRNWITSQLPTSARAIDLEVDPNDSNIIYLGAQAQ